MSNWFLICALLLITAFLSFKKKFEEPAGIIAFIVLLFFSFFRGESVGTDTAHYIEDLSMGRYYVDFNWGDSRTYEFVYQGLRLFLFERGWSGIWLTRFFSLCTFIVLYITTRRFKVNAAIVALMLMCTTFYPLSMNVARQIASVSFLLLGFSYLYLDHKKLIYCVCVFAAMLFHLSSLLFIVLAFIPNLNIKKEWLYLLMIISFACSYVLNISVFGTILDYLPFLHYADKYASEITQIESHNLFGALQYGLTLIFSIYVLHNSPTTEMSGVYDSLYGLSYIFTALFATVDSNIQRMAFGFSIFTIIYYAYYFAESSGNSKVKAISISCVFVQLLWIFNAIGHGTWEVTPFILDFYIGK